MYDQEFVPPTYSLCVGTDYAPPVKKQGLTRAELRERIDSFMKDEHAQTISITREPAHA